jgi:hypothetical protein
MNCYERCLQLGPPQDINIHYFSSETTGFPFRRILQLAGITPPHGERPCRFIAGKGAPGTHWVGGWVDPENGPIRHGREKILAPTGTGISTP